MGIKRVKKIDGCLVTRPAKNHPNPDYWFELRQKKAQEQNHQCGTCWRTSKEYVMELHHRHYNTWGNERPEDVVMLCVSCHDAITGVIRSRRMALGDQTFNTIVLEPKQIRSNKPKTRDVAIPGAVKVSQILMSARPKIKTVVIPAVQHYKEN